MPKKPQGCLKTNYEYAPLDDIKGQGRSVAKTVAQCQARCKAVKGCAYFSHWPDGGCHLSSSKAKPVKSLGVVSGTPSCGQKPKKTTPKKTGKGLTNYGA